MGEEERKGAAASCCLVRGERGRERQGKGRPCCRQRQLGRRAQQEKRAAGMLRWWRRRTGTADGWS
ncbi:hypothetical protein AMTR_s00052p00170690 [Amborella trichopoda]|uniref:Uncharacterized protein n=1 Tax=Amborella trichopoda TaxID=13333 RepID=U5CT49_AMBTC|nr:hypothetical protein AMTR_s00052p00170690 [Amborella trichopoda]